MAYDPNAHIAKIAARILGQRTELERRSNHLTQEELAQRAQVSVSEIERAEKGDLDLPIGVAFRIARAAGVSLFVPEKLSEEGRLMAYSERLKDKIALLTERPPSHPREIDDDF